MFAALVIMIFFCSDAHIYDGSSIVLTLLVSVLYGAHYFIAYILYCGIMYCWELMNIVLGVQPMGAPSNCLGGHRQCEGYIGAWIFHRTHWWKILNNSLLS